MSRTPPPTTTRNALPSIASSAPLLATLTVIAVLLVRLAPASMESWDEVQLELGMGSFDLAWHQPHPPGYPLFVLSGRLLAAIFHPAHPGRVVSIVAALGWVGLVAAWLPSALGQAARATWIAFTGAIVLLSPTLLTHATTGRTYVAEATLWTATLLLLIGRDGEGHEGAAAEPASPLDRWRPATLGAVVGIGGGFRPTLVVWGVAALAVWAVVQRRSWSSRALAQRIVVSVASLLLSVIAWVAALAVLSGGLERYAALCRPVLHDNIWSKSIFVRGPSVLAERLPQMARAFPEALGPLLVAVPLLLVARAKRAPTLRHLDALLYGSALAFTFYLVTIYDTDGYALSFVVPLITWVVLAGATLAATAPVRSMGTARLGGALGAIAIVWLVLPSGLASASSVPAARSKRESVIAARMAALASLPKGSTLRVTGDERLFGWSFRTLMYGSPDFPILQLARDATVPALSPDHPYWAAWHRGSIGVADDTDLATLPFFATSPLETIVFVVPQEISERIDVSCGPYVTALQVAGGRPMARIDLRGRVRVWVRGGALVCGGRER